MRGSRVIYRLTILLAIVLTETSCRKQYYNCECAYLDEYEQADTLMISVRATNSKKASKECAESEINIAEEHRFFVYCRLL
ncbi:MAG TPA: hypothetical protein VIN07_09220 [Flavipsychrobacter sp.]